MNKIKQTLDNNKFYDCRINYKCMNSIMGNINSYMAILSISPFFNNLFNTTKSDHVVENNRHINSYNINFTFTEISLLICINLMSDKTYSLDNCDAIDLLNAVLYLQLDKDHLMTIIKGLLHKILKSDDYNEHRYIICSVCASGVDDNIKKNFLARTLYLLQEDDKEDLVKLYGCYMHEHVFSNITAINNNKMIISWNKNGTKKISYMGIDFITYTTESTFENLETAFWLTCKQNTIDKVLKANIYLAVYNGYDDVIYNKINGVYNRYQTNTNNNVHQLLDIPYKNSKDRYGTVIEGIFDDLMVYEFIIMFE